MTSSRHTILFLLQIALLRSSFSATAGFPSIPQAKAPSTLDGTLTDEVWNKALELKLEKRPEFSSTKLKPVEPCHVRVFTDDANFYIGFTCESSTPPFVASALNTTQGQFGEQVLASDYVCALIDPGHWGYHDYYLVYVDSSGRLYVTASWWLQPVSQVVLCPKDLGAVPAETGIKAAVSKAADGKQWTAVMKIPFATLLRHPADGMLKKIGLNFRRVQWGADAGKVKEDMDWTRAIDRGTAGHHYSHMAMWMPMPSFQTWAHEGGGECWSNEAFLDEFGIVDVQAGKIDVKPVTGYLDDDLKEKSPVVYASWFWHWADENVLRMPRLDDIRAKDGWSNKQPKIQLPKVSNHGPANFTKKPQATRSAASVVTSFETDRETDVCVTVVNEKGRIVRHLAAGSLGANAPAPLKPGSLSQEIEWNFNGDDGKLLPPGNYRVKVDLGLAAAFERTIPMVLKDHDPAMWAHLLDVEHLPNPSGNVDDKTHGEGALNMAALDVERNELYLPGFRVHDATTGAFLRDFAPQEPAMAPWCKYSTNGEPSFGKDGTLYSTAFNGIFRLDAKGFPQPFSSTGRPHWPNLYLAHGNPHRGNCVGGPDGNIYMIHGFGGHGNFNSQVTELGTDGRLKKYGFIEMKDIAAAGVAVDRQGNVYVGCTVNPIGHALPEELSGLTENIKKIYELCYGSIVKFGPGGGHLVWDDQAKELHAGLHQGGFLHHTCRIDGAEWIHPGLSSLLTRARADAPVKCICRNARFSLDPSGRLFVPDSICGKIQVIDSAGNTLCYIGSRGTSSEKLQFRWAETILCGDEYCYALDFLQGQCVQIKLGYRTSEEVQLPAR